ncbi:response regulator [Parvibaculum sp.]|uniref:response regulator n=1 Tax=Parvibaculum sp. TaxID=2024848 RepID=UPI00320CA3C6
MTSHISTAFGVPLRRLDILIVDDSAQMQSLLRTILRGFGVAEMRQARDGTAALAEIALRAPTLIISDWEMAPMNGGEFLRHLRRVGGEPACFVPVIVLTAHASRDIIEEAFNQGATQLLVKPVTPANLLQRINWVLEDERPFEPVGGIWRQEMRLGGVDRSKPAPARLDPPVWTLD